MRFRGAASVVAVCGFCRSTLVREGAKLDDIGKQSELLEDASPLQLGAMGRHNGVQFTIVGRIQYRYSAGAWNEWYLLFPGGKGGWLSDADGKYLVTYLRAPAEVPGFDMLRPGNRLSLHGETFEVMNLENAEVVSGEGELPFKFLGGWNAPVVDLRGEKNLFATLDYSDTPPRIYIGEELPFDTFRFAGLRDPRVAAASVRARAFRCPNCAAPMEKRLATTQTVGCSHCGAAIDTTQDELAILAKHAEHTRYEPTIPLGSRAKFQATEYEVVGYLRRSFTAAGSPYQWGEYLLHNAEQGYLWLTEYRGHYNLVRSCAEVPKTVSSLGPPQVRYLGRSFKHFQRCEPVVEYLVGEFNWRVALGERCTVSDFVAPPLMLSCESTGKELNWSIGEYMDAESLWKAFRLKKPRPKPEGVYASQPSPHAGTERYWIVAVNMLLAAMAIHVALWLGTDAGELQHLELRAEPGRERRLASEVFEVRGSRPARLAIAAEAPGLQGGELELDYTLVNVADGRAWQAGQALWSVSGIEQGEHWSERQVKKVTHISGLPPGRYTLSVRGEVAGGPRAAAPASASISVYRDAPDAINLALLAGLLVPLPLIASLRARSFETARWAESDYAPIDDDDSSED